MSTNEGASPVQVSVTDIWPPPNNAVQLQAYKDSLAQLSPNGRGIRLTALVLEGSQADCAIPKIEQTVLKIDGKVVSDDLMILARATEKLRVYDLEGNLLCSAESGPYYFSWAPEIQPGQQQAKLKLVTTGGKAREYSWQFTVVE